MTQQQQQQFNIALTEEHIKRIFESVELQCPRINDLQLYQKAFVHCSFVEHKCHVNGVDPTTTESSYDVMEFLGDSVLNLTMSLYLVKRFVGASADRLTQLKIGLVRSGTLAQLAKFLNLHRYILIAEPIEFLSLTDIKVGRFNDKILEDVFESFLCALYMDQDSSGCHNNLQICYDFMAALLEKQVDFAKLIRTDQDPKGTFFAFCQSKSWQRPRLVNLSAANATTMLNSKEMAVALYMQKSECESCLESFAQSMITRNASKFVSATEEDKMKDSEILIGFQAFFGAHKKKTAIQSCYVNALERFRNQY